MINFFGQIRKKLADDNQFLKYSRYAIGEIVLVVIGILIALSINNWNERQKMQEKEFVLLNEIISDLENNERSADAALNRRFEIGLDSILKTHNFLIDHLEQKLPYNSTLNRQFFMIHQLNSMSYKQSGYESLKSSGMDLIQNDSIRSMIGWYYTVAIPESKEMATELRDDFYNYFLQFPRTIFITKKDEFGNWIQIPLDYNKLIENTEYIESLKMFTGIFEGNLNTQKWYLNETKKMRSKIELYLN